MIYLLSHSCHPEHSEGSVYINYCSNLTSIICDFCSTKIPHLYSGCQGVRGIFHENSFAFANFGICLRRLEHSPSRVIIVINFSISYPVLHTSSGEHECRFTLIYIIINYIL